MDLTLWRDDVRDPRDLLSHPRNPRTHSPEQIKQIRASMREFGFTNPVLISEDGRILAGHGRAIAAEAEEIDSIPVRVRDGAHPLTEAQELALIVADNKLALNAGWDDVQLASILTELRGQDFALDLLGFSVDEIGLLMMTGHEFQRGTGNDQQRLDQRSPIKATCPEMRT